MTGDSAGRLARLGNAHRRGRWIETPLPDTLRRALYSQANALFKQWHSRSILL